MASFKDIYTMIQTGELTIDDISLLFPCDKRGRAEGTKKLQNLEGGLS